MLLESNYCRRISGCFSRPGFIVYRYIQFIFILGNHFLLYLYRFIFWLQRAQFFIKEQFSPGENFFLTQNLLSIPEFHVYLINLEDQFHFKISFWLQGAQIVFIQQFLSAEAVLLNRDLFCTPRIYLHPWIRTVVIKEFYFSPKRLNFSFIGYFSSNNETAFYSVLIR